MNPRQRRGVLLLIVAAIGAVAVFVLVASYVASVRTEVGPTAPVLRLDTNVEAFEPVTASMVEPVEVPRRWLPDTAVRQVSELTGMVASADLEQGSYLQRDMLTAPPALAPGQREIAILVDAETGVAGKVRRGSYVDIFATFPGDRAAGPAGDKGTPASSRVIVRNARVLDVGQLEEISKSDPRGLLTPNKVVPVTFALSVQESLVLTYAESYATKVRLALIGKGDNVEITGSLVYEGGRPPPPKPPAKEPKPGGETSAVPGGSP